MLLDVQMPGLTGFEVARRLLDSGTDAALVFVTAFDQHAIEAFEVNAVDYLLKPVEAARLETGGRARAAQAPGATATPAGTTSWSGWSSWWRTGRTGGSSWPSRSATVSAGPGRRDHLRLAGRRFD